MKKQLLLSSLAMIGLSGAIIAQPTLTAVGINPVIGDAITINNANYVNPGSSGPNQTWDLSSFSSSGTATSNVVSVGSTPQGSSFPSSSNSGTDGSNYSYFTTSSTAWQISGDVTSAGSVIIYTDNEDLLHYPFSYGNSYTDNFNATYTNAGYTYYRSGNITVDADSYGTLILPNGTYSNVMRVHFHEVYHDSVDFGGFPYIVDYDNDAYTWYLNGNHSSIASVNTFVVTGNTVSSGTYRASIIGIKENIDNSDLFTTFPSPASTQLTIETKNSTAFETAEITSASGSKVMNVNLSNNVGSSTIDVSSLAAGVYFIELKNNDGVTARRKFVVTH